MKHIDTIKDANSINEINAADFLETIKTKPIKVLDKGFIRLVDVYGSDARIVEAARVSYQKGTKKKRDNSGLINYLLRNHHTSPFEMCEIVLHCKMPIFVARQWVRHRTASLNEISGRYSVLENEFFLPDTERFRAQSKTNKQGSDDAVLSNADLLRDAMFNDQESAGSNYNWLLDEGVSREIARINLPLSQYTQWYWKIDLNNLFKFLKLRMDEHAQEEIRMYANVIADITAMAFPLAYKAFEEHILHAFTFSGDELHALNNKIYGVPFQGFKSKTQEIEFNKKLDKINMLCGFSA